MASEGNLIDVDEEKNFDTDNDFLRLQQILFENIDDDESDEATGKGLKGNEKHQRSNEINGKSLTVSGQGSVNSKSTKRSDAQSSSNQINLKSAKRSDVLSRSNESHRGASDSPRRSTSRNKSALAIGGMI